jgi:hypothetical protein
VASVSLLHIKSKYLAPYIEGEQPDKMPRNTYRTSRYYDPEPLNGGEAAVNDNENRRRNDRVPLINGSDFQDPIPDDLGRLLDLLHLLADARPCGFVSALSLLNIGFDFSDQRLQHIVLLHLRGPPFVIVFNREKSNGLDPCCQRKTALPLKKTRFLHKRNDAWVKL